MSSESETPNQQDSEIADVEQPATTDSSPAKNAPLPPPPPPSAPLTPPPPFSGIPISSSELLPPPPPPLLSQTRSADKTGSEPTGPQSPKERDAVPTEPPSDLQLATTTALDRPMTPEELAKAAAQEKTAAQANAPRVPLAKRQVLTKQPPSAEITPPGPRDPYGLDQFLAGHSAQHATALAVAVVLLDKDEVVDAVLAGRYMAHNCVAVSTNRRVLIANDRHFSPDIVSFDRYQELSLRVWVEPPTMTVRIDATTGSAVIGSITHSPSFKTFSDSLS